RTPAQSSEAPSSRCAAPLSRPGFGPARLRRRRGRAEADRCESCKQALACPHHRSEAYPIERWPGIGLSAWRDVAVPDDPVGAKRGVRSAQGHDEIGELAVLNGLVGLVVGAFELDSDGIIIAALPPAPARYPGMPGT